MEPPPAEPHDEYHHFEHHHSGGAHLPPEERFSRDDREGRMKMKKAPPAQEDKATNNVSDAELKARAKAMGIDLVRESQSSISPALGVLKIFPLLLLHAS